MSTKKKKPVTTRNGQKTNLQKLSEAMELVFSLAGLFLYFIITTGIFFGTKTRCVK